MWSYLMIDCIRSTFVETRPRMNSGMGHDGADCGGLVAEVISRAQDPLSNWQVAQTRQSYVVVELRVPFYRNQDPGGGLVCLTMRLLCDLYFGSTPYSLLELTWHRTRRKQDHRTRPPARALLGTFRHNTRRRC